jgi:hypothetical protein
VKETQTKKRIRLRPHTHCCRNIGKVHLSISSRIEIESGSSKIQRPKIYNTVIPRSQTAVLLFMLRFSFFGVLVLNARVVVCGRCISVLDHGPFLPFGFCGNTGRWCRRLLHRGLKGRNTSRWCRRLLHRGLNGGWFYRIVQEPLKKKKKNGRTALPGWNAATAFIWSLFLAGD